VISNFSQGPRMASPISNQKLQVRRGGSAIRSSSEGFTLVELLVVIAIIGVLVAMLLPAVQAAREAARRSQCSNNLKQMGLAILNYTAAMRVLPPGAIIEGPCCDTPARVSWPISILPYMEEQALFEQYHMEVANEAPINQPFREANIAAYGCPSDPFLLQKDMPETGLGSGSLYRHSSYRGCAGYTNGAGKWEDQVGPGQTPADFLLPGGWRGPFFTQGYSKFHGMKLAHIQDGTSKTLLVGEGTRSTRPARGSFWAYSYSSYNKGSIYKISAILLADYEQCIATAGNICKQGWGSMHPGGLHFLLCDGSVRMVDDYIDMEVLASAATIAGSELSDMP
jgi:prepilin-type N-terminal cleavage/methylation domain-containing protein/prepilin-type processing-associated H-X9-DG protein